MKYCTTRGLTNTTLNPFPTQKDPNTDEAGRQDIISDLIKVYTVQSYREVEAARQGGMEVQMEVSRQAGPGTSAAGCKAKS